MFATRGLFLSLAFPNNDQPLGGTAGIGSTFHSNLKLVMVALNIVFLMRGLALVLPIAPALDQEKREGAAPDIRHCADRT
jgi:hypothetical protein